MFFKRLKKSTLSQKHEKIQFTGFMKIFNRDDFSIVPICTAGMKVGNVFFKLIRNDSRSPNKHVDHKSMILITVL